MLNLSEILLQNIQLEGFEELKQLITQRALEGEIHFRVDIKPPFRDTPEDWEDQLEMAFYEPNRAHTGQDNE